jgi:hypothetical protein
MAAKKPAAPKAEQDNVTEVEATKVPGEPVFNPDKPYAENFGNPKDPVKYIQTHGGRVCHFKSDGTFVEYAG